MSTRFKTDTVAQATRPDPEGGDGLALARINRERDLAALRFARDLEPIEVTSSVRDGVAEPAAG